MTKAALPPCSSPLIPTPKKLRVSSSFINHVNNPKLPLITIVNNLYSSSMMPTAMHGEAVPTVSPSFLTRLRGLVSPKKPAQLRVPPHHTALPAPSSRTTAGEFDRVFHYFDEDGDGKISPVELRNCMLASGEELSHEDAEDVVRCNDSDGDGLLGMEDFVRLVGGGEEEKGQSLRAAFGAFEMEGRGCITAKSLKRALGRLGESKTVKECKEMIRRFDVDGDGVISFEEFTIMMMH